MALLPLVGEGILGVLEAAGVLGEAGTAAETAALLSEEAGGVVGNVVPMEVEYTAEQMELMNNPESWDQMALRNGDELFRMMDANAVASSARESAVMGFGSIAAGGVGAEVAREAAIEYYKQNVDVLHPDNPGGVPLFGSTFNMATATPVQDRGHKRSRTVGTGSTRVPTTGGAGGASAPIRNFYPVHQRAFSNNNSYTVGNKGNAHVALGSPRNILDDLGAPKIHFADVRMGLPGVQLKTLRYVYGGVIDMKQFDLGTAPICANLAFRANSISQPLHHAVGSFTEVGTARQPYGHDQWAALYNDYIVVSSRICVTFNKATQFNVVDNVDVEIGDRPFIATVRLNSTGHETVYSGSTDRDSVRRAIEMGDCSFAYCHPYDVVTLRNSFNSAKYFNIKDVQDNFDSHGAAFGNNCANEAYFNILCGYLDESTAFGLGVNAFTRIQMLVRIEYLCAFSNPKDVSAS